MPNPTFITTERLVVYIRSKSYVEIRNNMYIRFHPTYDKREISTYGVSHTICDIRCRLHTFSLHAISSTYGFTTYDSRSNVHPLQIVCTAEVKSCVHTIAYRSKRMYTRFQGSYVHPIPNLGWRILKSCVSSLLPVLTPKQYPPFWSCQRTCTVRWTRGVP